MGKIAAILQSWGTGGVFLLAVLDSAGIPLPAAVDLLIMAVAITNPSLAWLTAAVSIVGSLIGCMILFALARKGGNLYLDLRTASPRSRKFREWFGRYGLVTVFIPCLVPIPLPVKVFVLSAGALGVRPRSFFLTVLAARVPRYFGIAWLGLQLGHDAQDWLKAHVWHLAAFAVVLVAVSVGLIRLAEQRRSVTETP